MLFNFSPLCFHYKQAEFLVFRNSLHKEIGMNATLYKGSYEDIRERYGATNAINHILRTPITCILGFNHCLNSTSLTAEQKEYTQNIEKSTQALLGAIDFLSKEISSQKQQHRKGVTTSK